MTLTTYGKVGEGASQKALAADLGVSQMTVSRVLRGENGVSDQLRERILSVARDSGFAVPDIQRRPLTDRVHVVCSIVPVKPSESQDKTHFQVRLLNGLQSGGRDCGSEVVNVGDCDLPWPRIVARRQVDGVVHVFGGDPGNCPRIPCPVPHVSIFYPIDDQSDLVTIGNLEAARSLGDHLGRLGHRRVAFIGPTTAIARDRLTGLRLGLAEHGGGIAPENIHLRDHASDFSVAGQLDALIPAGMSATGVRGRFTAIAIYNDDMAVRGIRHLTARGFRVPSDLSITGFDGAVPASFHDIQLTTASIPLEHVGAEAVRLLYWRLDYPKAPARRLILDAPLVEGETTVAIPSSP